MMTRRPPGRPTALEAYRRRKAIADQARSEGVAVNISGGAAAPTDFWAIIQSATSVGTRKWKYTVAEVEKTLPGYAGWTLKDGGRNTVDDEIFAWNWIEHLHAASLTGLVVVPTNTIVRIQPVTLADGSATEWWFAAVDYTECGT